MDNRSANGRERSFEVASLSKVFTMGGGLSRSRIVAVNDATFSVGRDGPQIFTLAGESGSGKTTLARILVGIYPPTSGSVRYQGRSLASIQTRRERMWFMREVQPIFQNPFETFSPLKRVQTYLLETARNYRIGRTKKEVEAALEKALESVGLTIGQVRGKYPNEFSGGQLQRISIARALVTSPSTLIADEPVSMVDASMRMSIVNLFRQLKEEQGVNVLYITHDLATAYYVSDRIAIMLRGNIVEVGTVEQVLAAPLHPYTKLLIESIPEPDPRQRWEEEIVLSNFEEVEFARSGCKFASRCPFAMEICRIEPPPYFHVDGRDVQCFLYSEDRRGR